MPTLYFSYSLPGGSLDINEPISSPYTISYHVGHMLRARAEQFGYDFRFVNLDDETPQTFDVCDVCVGHVWDTPNSFMQQALRANVRAKIVLQPYSHKMVSDGDILRYIDLFSKADELLFVTGEYWHSTMLQSPFESLFDRVTRLDMAVNTESHPFKKQTWNKKGERSICVIGHDTPTKGYKNVAELARVAGVRLGHFGSPSEGTFDHVPCMILHGGMTFTPENIAALCQNYDACLALPLADACPTVLLEAAAWGLRIYTAKESGYLPDRPFNELRKDNLAFNVNAMRDFQTMDEYELKRDSLRVRQIIEREYTFKIMCDAIWQKVETYL